MTVPTFEQAVRILAVSGVRNAWFWFYDCIAEEDQILFGPYHSYEHAEQDARTDYESAVMHGVFEGDDVDA